MKLLLLDIDGVLNDHKKLRNNYCTIYPEKVYLLDEIVLQTHCRIVLVSAWRYLILSESMNLTGFGHMLRTYGASELTIDSLLGLIPKDVDITDPHDRGKLARLYVDSWIAEGGVESLSDVVVLDDLALGYTEAGLQFVQTQSKIGLTEADVAKVIEMFHGN